MGGSLRRLSMVALVVGLLVAFTAAGARAATYVALGDSYSSGVGTRSYYSDSGSCYRSPYAYPVLAAPRLGATLTFVACSGAKTDNVLSSQIGSLKSGTNFVTISIGGNDAGFSNVIASCARPWPWTCWGDINNAKAYIQNTLPGKLNQVYSQIRSRSPSAAVAVVGYPRIFNGKDQCNFASRISPGEQKELNATANLLRDVTRARALAHGFKFADAIPSFVGHAVCDNPEWVNGLSNPVMESYHPNRLGQAQYANLVDAQL